jgi:hypothetical protein
MTQAFEGASTAGFDRVEGLPRSPDEVVDTFEGDVAGPADTEPEAADATHGDAGTQAADATAPGMASQPPDLTSEPGQDPDATDPSGSVPVPPLTPTAPDGFPRLETEVVVDEAPTQLWRGQELRLRGRIKALDGDAAVADRPVHLVAVPLAPDGLRTTLASAQTDDMGVYEFVVEVPATLPTGQWEIFVYFPGDERFLAGRSR